MAISIFPRVDASGALRGGPLRKGHWSTRGLLLCNTFAQSVPAAAYPRSRAGVMSSSAATSAMGNPLGMSFTVAAHRIEHQNFTETPLAQATVLCVRKCADTTLRAGQLFGANIASTSNRFVAFVPLNDGTIYWDFGGSGVTGGRLTTPFAKTTQVEKWAFLAGRNGTAIWRNGVRLAASTTPVTTRTAASTTFSINGAITTQDGDIQDIYFFALLDAEWTPTQILEWTSNPWLMFAAPPIGYATAGIAAPAAGLTVQPILMVG